MVHACTTCKIDCRELREGPAAGVPIRSVRYNGTIHDFMLLNAIASTPPVRGAVDQASEYLREVFADQ